MKLFRTLGALMVVAIVAGLLAGCAAAPASTTKKFTIASDATFPPMENVDANKNIVGFDVDLINAIAKDQKFAVEIKNTAWDGIFAGLEGGAYDAILSSVTITDDRKKTYDFSDPYFDANQAIVVRADDNTIKSEQEIARNLTRHQMAAYMMDEVGFLFQRISSATPEQTLGRK